jgi:hypothetical protein
VSENYDQQGLTPTKKVTAATTAGAAAILVTFALGQLGVDVTPEAAAAIATVLAFLGGWFKRESAPSREDVRAAARSYTPHRKPTRKEP